MSKLYKIKFIKNTEKCIIGEIVSASKKSAESYVKNGYAKYVEIPKKKKETPNRIGPKDLTEKDWKENTKLTKEFRDKKNKEEPQNPFTKKLNKLEHESEFEGLKTYVFAQLLDKKRRDATETIVQYIKKNEHIYTTRDDEKSEVWIYKEGIYISQGKTFVRELCRIILNEAYTTQICNEVIAKIEADTYVGAEEFFSVKYLNKIVVENGILDLKTKRLTEFTHKKIFFNKLPVIYDPKAECVSINKHFEEVLEHKDDLHVMFELFGYLLYKEYKIEKAFIFSGSGRNGKSKTIELMKRFIGADSVVSISLQDIENDPYCISELMNKMANLAGDISNKSLKDTSSFKGLTGRDYISANRKFKTRVSFQNFAKMIFSANELPITYDKTPAFWNRWLIINFPYTFVSEKEYVFKGENEKVMCKVADKDIVEKITTKEELSGLLNKALEGLQKLLKQGDFSYSKTTEQVKEMWIRKSDSFAGFLMDCVKEDFDSVLTKEELRRAYNQYCKEFKLKICNDKHIKNELEITYGAYEDRKLIENKQIRLWKGITFKPKISQGRRKRHGFYTIGKLSNSLLSKNTPANLSTLSNFECNNCGVKSNNLTVEGLCPTCSEK